MILFVLRLLSATLLLSFLGLLVWFVRGELRSSRSVARRSKTATDALELVADDGTVSTRYLLRSVTSIGRLPSNTVVIPESYVSAEHALLTRRGDQWWLEDLGSRNGTLLNSTPVAEPIAVQDGDIISIGDTHLRLTLTNE